MALIPIEPCLEWQLMLKRVRKDVSRDAIKQHLINVDICPELIESHLSNGLNIYTIYSMAIGEGFNPYPNHPLPAL